MIIGGKEYNFKLNMGTLKKFQRISGKNPFKVFDDFGAQETSWLIQAGIEQAGQNITDEELDNMTIDEMTSAGDSIAKAMKDFAPKGKN